MTILQETEFCSTNSKKASMQNSSYVENLKFLTNLSHELRTPLNGIIGISDLIQQNIPEDVKKDYLGILKQISHNLLELVNNVLDFSKIECQNLNGIYKEFDFRKTLSRNIYSQKFQADIKGLKLELEMDENLPSILVGDAVKIGQIFTNLISNAIKFTDKGEIKVKVQTVQQTNKNVLLHCSVKDTGIGIP